MGLGLAALGRPGYINLGRSRDLGETRSVEALRERTFEVLDAAWAAGIRYLDTARSYGLAEAFLADWLTARAIAPGDVVVGSKWGYTYTADWTVGATVNEVKDHSLATLERQVAESLALLGPWLRLYQVHSATLDSGILDDRAVLERLARLRDDGLVVGLSVSGPGQAATIERAVAIQVDGRPLFGSVQATWNVLERSAGAALAAAHAAGLGVIVKEVLANGRLAQPDVFTDHGFSAAAAPPDALAIAAALAEPWVDVVLSGAVTVAQLATNIRGASLAIGGAERTRLASMAEAPDAYWSTRSGLAWS